jgi:hypothetical protein
MKRTRAIILLVAGVLIVACLVCFALFHSDSIRVATDRINSLAADKIVAAAQTYAHDLEKKGLPVPASVDLKELVANNLLSREDVKGFDGMEVSISLKADETRPGDVLMQARLKDGSQVVLMGDGSVQQFSNKRAKAGQSNANIRNNQ